MKGTKDDSLWVGMSMNDLFDRPDFNKLADKILLKVEEGSDEKPNTVFKGTAVSLRFENRELVFKLSFMNLLQIRYFCSLNSI